jgi:AmpE protein
VTFIALLLALALYQAWGQGGALHRDEWFRAWESKLEQWPVPPGLAVAAAVLVPVLLAGTLLDVVRPALFGLLWIAGAAAVLLYSLGRGDYRHILERYRDYCRQGDFESAWLAAVGQWDLDIAGASPGTPQQARQDIQRALYYEGFQRWFPPVFYFCLLGPAGALSYRLAQLGRGGPEPQLSGRLVFLLDWVPARLLAAVFVLTGDFVASRERALQGILDYRCEASALLSQVGGAAVGPLPGGLEPEDAAAEECSAVQALLSRSAGAWLIGIAVLALLPW